jgi:hypothetical protein
MMLRFCGSAGLSGCWVHMQEVGEVRNAHRCSLLWLVQYGTWGKRPSFCCNNFFRDFFLILCSCLCLSSAQQFSPFPVTAITCDRTGRVSNWLMQCKRIPCRVCSVKNKETSMKLKCLEHKIGLCVTPCFEVYHTKLHFWGPNDTIIERWNTQMYVNITIVIINWYFSVTFSLWNNGGEGGVNFTGRALRRDRDLSEGPLRVCICFTSPIWRKNNYCLETSVNNSWLLEKS